MNKSLPVVAIIGRPNVGKSSLFNRLIGERRAIVAEEVGTTRDKVTSNVTWNNQAFLLIDTAGIMAADTQLEADVQQQVEEAIAAADLLLMVADSNTIPTQEDKDIAKKALKSQKPLLLAVNKMDAPEGKVPPEFKKLGIKTMHGVSAIHGRGSGDLLDAITSQIPKKLPKSDTRLTIALLGRPNVGKSSIFNVLSGSRKAVISQESGTTRDVNRAEINFEKQPLTILDTAGIRRSGKIRPGIERFSFSRTVNAIQEADICVVLLDGTEPATALDQKIAGMVAEAGKGLILALNKWDLLREDETEVEMANRLIGHKFQFVWWAPLVYSSAVSKHNTYKLLELSLEIAKRRQKKISTPQLNKVLQNATAHHPPAAFKSKHPKLSYITQTDAAPPKFTVFGTHTDFMHWSYTRYLETTLRENFDLRGTPIWLEYRPKSDRKKIEQ